MPFFLVPAIIAFVIILLPFFIHKDTDKPRYLVFFNWFLVVLAFVIGIVVNPEILGPTMKPFFVQYILVLWFNIFPACLVLSIVGFIMEITDNRKRGRSFINAMWSTSFLVILCVSALVLFLLTHADI